MSNAKGELAILAIEVEELVDYMLPRIFVKLRKYAPIVYVDETAMMSERDS